MTFTEVMERVAQAFEALGVLILGVGTLWSFLLAGLAWRRSGHAERGFAILRQAIGASLLLGLEVLVAADLVRTIAVAPTLDNVLILGLIVLIRTFLSFSLEIEMTGMAPWHRGSGSRAGMTSAAAASRLKPQDADQPPAGRPGQPPG
jgi:uncharacterized membrane protein